MIITLINFLSEKINNFKRRNRNQPSHYRFFLFWLSLIILITAIFYVINNLNKNKYYFFEIESSMNDVVDSNQINLISSISQEEIFKPPKSELYENILNDIQRIPKPLSFVDDFDFKL